MLRFFRDIPHLNIKVLSLRGNQRSKCRGNLKKVGKYVEIASASPCSFSQRPAPSYTIGRYDYVFKKHTPPLDYTQQCSKVPHLCGWRNLLCGDWDFDRSSGKQLE